MTCSNSWSRGKVYGRNAYGTESYGDVRSGAVRTVIVYLHKKVFTAFITFKRFVSSHI